MSGSSPASFSGLADGSLPRRIAVTLAALAIYRIGSWIPLPGVDVEALVTSFDAGSPRVAIERISVMALGVNAWLSVLILAEVAMLSEPALRRWATSKDNAGSFQGWVVLLTLAMAGYQANGIAVALESMDTLVAAPGLFFRFGIIASLVSATAFLIWIASLVSRYGLGSGFLLFLAAPFFMDVPGMLAAQAVAWGPAFELSVPLTIGVFAAAAAALVYTAGPTPSSAALGQLLWPPLLAYAATLWLPILILIAVAPEHISAATEAFKSGQPIRIVVVPALTAAIYLWRARSLAASGEADDSLQAPRSNWTGALVVAAVMAAFEGLLAFLPLPLALDGRSVVIMVAFALSVLSTLRPAAAPAR
jgi:preprotein translocase subunit SecY